MSTMLVFCFLADAYFQQIFRARVATAVFPPTFSA